jgi:polyphosphate kinase
MAADIGAEPLVLVSADDHIPAQARRSALADGSTGQRVELSARILQRAAAPRTPLVERLRLLALFAEQIDDLFMVAAGRFDPAVVHALVTRRDTIIEGVRADLAGAGITILRWNHLSRGDQKRLRALLLDRIGPVLTPLAVDPAHPFPRVSGLSLNLAVRLRDRDTGAERFACVEIPPLLPRFISLGDLRFARLEEIVAAHLPELFPGLDVVERRCFRVTRSQHLDAHEGDASDLLIDLERKAIRRRFGAPVRLEIDETVSSPLLDLLVHQLGVDTDSTYFVADPLAMGAGLWTIPNVFPQH